LRVLNGCKAKESKERERDRRENINIFGICTIK